MGVRRRETTLGFGCWLDHGGEMLHALETFALALTAEIKDEFTDSEAAIRNDIRNDLLCGTRKGSTFEPGLTLCGQRDVVDRGFIGDCERFRIASSCLGQALEVSAVGIHHGQFKIPPAAGGEDDPLAVGGPGRMGVDARS